MGSSPSSRRVEDPELRSCGLCGSITTRWFCYDEEPILEDAKSWTASSRIICGLCVDAILSALNHRPRP
jgi:hypothetical protein